MIYNREIIKKTLDGEEIAKYKNLTEAEASIEGAYMSNIHRACLQNRPYKGFIWEFGECKVRNKAVAAYDLKGNLVQEFDSIKDAYNSDIVQSVSGMTLKSFREKLRLAKNKRDASVLGYMWRVFPADEKAPERVLPYILKNPIYNVGKQLKRTKIAMMQDGEVIKIYDDIDKAKKDFPDLTEEIISYKRELFGCTFKRVGLNELYEIVERGEKRGGKPRPVRRFNLFGELIAEYPSAHAAARAVGTDRRHMGNALKGYRKTLAGSVWEFMSD